MQKLDPKAFWLFFSSSLIVGLAMVIFFIVLIGSSMLTFLMAGGEAPPTWLSILISSLIFIAYIIFSYIWAKLTYHFWAYEFREDALRIEKGVIWKRYVSIPYERIQNVDIHRGVFARILGLSDLQIQTAGFSVSYGRGGGAGSEGRLPGLDQNKAEELRDELIRKAKGAKQGL